MTAQAEARHEDFHNSPDTFEDGPRRRTPSAGPFQPSADTDVNTSPDMENILERVMTRLDENDRRYGAALDGLQSRIAKVSSRAGQGRSALDPAAQAALERVESHAAQLSRDVQQAANTPPPPHEDAFRAIEERISDFSLRADDGRGTRRAPSPAAAAPRAPAPPPWPAPREEPVPQYRPSLDMPPVEQPALDRGPAASPGAKFSSAAARLEESLGARAPSAGLEAINQRMDELAQRLDEALLRSPDAASIQRIESQLSEIAPYFSTLQDQHRRLEAVEQHLQGLVDWLKSSNDQSHARMEQVARQAAEEAVRQMPAPQPVSGHSDQQLDSIQYELRAMNERAERMDERTVRALESMTESMHLLAQRLDDPALAARTPREEAQAWTQPAHDRGGHYADPDAAEVHIARGEQRQTREYDDPHDLDALGAAIPDYQPPRRSAAAPFDEPMPSERPARAVHHPAPLEDDEDDFIASARRAARSAAARAAPAEKRGGLLFRRSRRDAGQDAAAAAPVYPEYERQRRARPFFVGTAVLLLCVSAYLFYERLKAKPDTAAPPPAPQQTVPAPVPLPQKSSQSLVPRETAPLPGATPGMLARSFDTTAQLERPQAAAIQPAPVPQEAPKEPGRLGFEASVVDRNALRTAESSRIAAEMFGVDTRAVDAARASEGRDSRLPGATVRVEEPQRAPAAQRRAADTPAKAEVVPGIPAGSMPPATIGPESLRLAAARGNAAAQYEVGIRYAKGSGVPVDMERAAQWLSRAAAQGLAPAQFRLASLYERGQGVDADAGKARAWYERSAQQGHVKAMHNLGVMLSSGNASAADYTSAAAWFQRAAQQGLTDSQFNLGILYEAGLGVQKNPAEAYRWFSTAAARGDKEAEKRREQVRTQLSGKMLQQLDQFLAQWRPDQPDMAANEVRTPEGGWSAAAAGNGPAAGEDLVVSAQKLLNALGYDAGVPDGMLGPQTISAIRRFENRSGLQDTGTVTPELLTRLKALAS
ncbi:MAG: peptidoglycan-binding protein [Hyphomicrobiales bacterium]